MNTMVAVGSIPDDGNVSITARVRDVLAHHTRTFNLDSLIMLWVYRRPTTELPHRNADGKDDRAARVEVPDQGAPGISVVVWWALDDGVVRHVGNKTLLRGKYGALVVVGLTHCGVDQLDTEGGFLCCYDKLKRELEGCGLSFEDVVKTWTFYGRRRGLASDIFEAFNRARRRFFANHEFRNIIVGKGQRRLPANTGLISSFPDGICAIACRPSSELRIRGLESPLIAPAYEGQRTDGPLFSRAVCVESPNEVTLWVSGMGSRLSWSRSPRKHVQATLQLLESVISLQNLDAAGVDTKSLESVRMVYCIAYIADDGDRCEVDFALGEALGGRAPHLVVNAGLAKAEFRIEIECVAEACRRM